MSIVSLWGLLLMRLRIVESERPFFVAACCAWKRAVWEQWEWNKPVGHETKNNQLDDGETLCGARGPRQCGLSISFGFVWTSPSTWLYLSPLRMVFYSGFLLLGRVCSGDVGWWTAVLKKPQMNKFSGFMCRPPRHRRGYQRWNYSEVYFFASNISMNPFKK